MSEPMKSEAIEDVLSSVRRLVSDNSSTKAKTDAETANKLLLTADQRIPESNLARIEAPVEGAAKADLAVVEAVRSSQSEDANEEADTATGLEWSPDDRMANWDDVGSSKASSEEFEPESGAPDIADDTSGAIARALAEALAAGSEDDATEKSHDEDAEVLLLTPEDVEAVKDGPATASEENVLEEDASEKSAPQEVASEDQAAAPEPAPLDDLDQELAELSGNDIEEAEDTPDETPVFSRTKRAEDRVAEFGAQIDAASGDDALEDHIEDLGDRAALFGYGDDESVLDEEGLREIISQVVREELQGVLGQRITRNVRKMVRREIRMTLAAEDLE